MYLLKMNLKDYRHLIQSIFVVKVILKMLVIEIIQYFRQNKNIFKKVGNTDNYSLEWKSKGLSHESIKPPSTSTNILNSLLNHVGTKSRTEFKGCCLKQVVNI